MRVPALFVGLFVLCAASPPEPPPVPETLKSYVKDGRLDPGDYGWMKGGFSDATPPEKQAFDKLLRWRSDCLKQAQDKASEQLAALGYPDAKPNNIPSTMSSLCRDAFYLLPQGRTKPFADFKTLAEQPLMLARTYIAAARAAEQIALPQARDLSSALTARIVGEQVVRYAASWGGGPMKDVPPLSPEAKQIFMSRIGQEMAEFDERNTSWLKGVIEKQGWPKKSDVGEAAANAAWLLVQHADADPSFQLKALKLMEPLVPAGEVSKSNYALLYDRVMLKLIGKQRYATQMSCKDGKWTPSLLEDNAAVDSNRAEVGLAPLADYVKEMTEAYGPCSAA
jgi:hypothetical protein